MIRPALVSMLFLLLVQAACGPTVRDEDPPDAASTTDAGEQDAGDVDAGEADGGDADAGEVDAGPACHEGNCAGCCVDDTCVEGLSATACGNGGEACTVCDVEDECRAGSCELPLGPGPGDTCTDALVLSPVNGTAQRYVSFDRLTDDTQTTCGTGPDLVVTFEVLDDATDVTLSVTTTEANVEPSLSLRESCGSTAELACEAETVTRRLDAGTYFAWIKTTGTPTQPLLVKLALKPTLTSETCEDATSLAFNASGAASRTIASGHDDDFELDCVPGETGPDSAYRIRIDETSDLRASVRTPNGYPYGTVVALRSACGGPDLACGTAIELTDLPPGDYWLLRDSNTYESSSLTAHVALSPPRAPGETCARARPLTLVSGHASVSGNLTGATDDVEGKCSSVGGRDHVYAFTIDEPLRVSATATRTSGTGSLSLRMMAPDRCPTGATSGCKTGTSATVVQLLTAGTYLLVVDSDTVGGYTLELQAEPPAPAESCLNPVSFTFPAGGGTEHYESTFVGSTQENFNNACMGSDRPDHVFRVVTTDPLSNLRVVATPLSGSNAPGVMLVKACNEIVALSQACGQTAATRTLSHTALPAGEWFVWVKSPSTQGVPYTLDFTVSPTPDGDTCSNAFQLALSDGLAGGTASVTGDTTGAADDFTSCSQISPTFPDEVYEFTIDRALDLRATLKTASGSTGVLSMLNDTCRIDYGTCGRHNGEDARLKVSSLQPGTHRFSVDHLSGGPGPYSLDVELAPHRPGETCANPIPLTLSDGQAGGTAQVSVDLREFIDDEVDCFGSAADVFYSFTTDRTLDVRVAAQSDEPVRIGLFGDCSYSDTCTTLYEGGFARGFARGSVPPGTWILAVDTEFPRQEGELTLDVALTPPTPGDSCEVAIPLAIAPTGGTVQVEGSTAGAFDFHQGGCHTFYPERIYSFTTTEPLNLIAHVASEGGTKAHAVTLKKACDGNALTCVKGGGVETIVRATDLPAGTYHLFVDKSDYSAPDDFTLAVTLGPRPTGDRCETALPLGLPVSGEGEVQVQGDTRPFFHDVTAACGSTTTTDKEGADVLYTFTTTETMNLRLLVDAKTTGFRPTVSLRRGCGSADDDLVCGWVPTYATDAWASYRNLPAGTWYVSVDGYGTTHSGQFDLIARLSAAQTGESCSNPRVLSLSGGGSGTATASGRFADFFDDHSDCWNHSGSDAVFQVTTDRHRRLHAFVEVSESSAQPTLSVRGAAGCATSTGALACERSSFDGTGRVSADLPTGTSYILVKSGLAKPVGTFDLTVQVDDFEPGDTCGDAIPLVFTGGEASATVDPYRFGADTTLSCATQAPDAFFTFTTTETKDFTATLSAEDTRQFAMSIRPSCTALDDKCASSPFVSGLTLERPSLPAGTWVVVVRGGTTQPSEFTLAATLTSP